MAERRMLSKKISISEQVNDCSLLAVVAFSWGILHADDWGIVTGNPRKFKALVLPLRPEGADEVAAALDELVEAKLVVRYEVGGERWLWFPNFDAYQTGLHKRTAQRRNPTPAEADAGTLSAPEVCGQWLEDGSDRAAAEVADHEEEAEPIVAPATSGKFREVPGSPGKSPEVPEVPGSTGNFLEVPGGPGTSRKFREIPGNSTPREQNRREQNRTEQNNTPSADADGPPASAGGGSGGGDSPPGERKVTDEQRLVGRLWEAYGFEGNPSARTYGRVMKIIQAKGMPLLEEFLTVMLGRLPSLPPGAKPEAWFAEQIHDAAFKPWEWQKAGGNGRGTAKSEPADWTAFDDPKEVLREWEQ